MLIKKCFILVSIFILSTICVFADETIRAENNAYRHNNKGLIYLDEKYYYGAIKEFEIAIGLNPDSQASATYYINLARTYDIIGYPDLATKNYEKALSLYPLYFDYYVKVVENYKTRGLVKQKLKEFRAKPKNPLNDIVIGLLYIYNGQKSIGVTVLDEFCNKEENLMITTGVRNYLKQITK